MSADPRAGVGRPGPVIKVAASTAAQAKAAAQIQRKGVDDCGAPSAVEEYFEGVVGEGFCPVVVALQEHSASQPEVGCGLGALVRQAFGGANRGMAGNVCGLCTVPPGRSFQHEGLPGAGSVPRARPVGSPGRRPVRATRRGCPPANATGALGAGALGPRPRDYARSSGRGMERPPRSALLTQT